MGLGNCTKDAGAICIQKASSPPPGGMMFTLKRVREDPDPAVSSDSLLTPNRRGLSKGQVDCGSDDEKILFQALRNKPWLSYDDFEIGSEDESNCEQMSTAARSLSLPVGIVRGCMSCEGCQKVLARWRPGAGCRPTLEDAPVFFPLEEEFKDTIKYIASIRGEAEQYGICRIVPPHSWRPPCPLKDSEKRRTAKFRTKVQQLDKLQLRKAQVKKEETKRRQGRLSRRDGYTGRRSLLLGESCKDACSESSDEEGKFGFEPGPPFTLEAFEKYAHQFKEEYFGLREQNEVCSDSVSKREPSVECIEGEYWRIVEHATEQLEVLYGADIESGVFGSGFPKAKPGIEPSFYESSGWNLNNIARLPGSVLFFEEEEISGVLVPWLYVGMCFSSFCWHVEDHHFYSLNYMHFGSPKVWYGVPGNAAHKLEDAMKKHLPDLFEEQPDLLHKLVTQLSPSVLKAAGVPVYRAVQKPGEFVVTFPRAYHAGFNCGFNCAEAVNVAPIDWLPCGQNAIELYKQQRRKSTVSHDKLLLGAAKKFLITSHNFPGVQVDADLAAWQELFGQCEVLLKVLKNRVDLERTRRAKVEQFVHIRKMDRDFDAIDERECSVCHYDLHLSAIGCECVGEHFTCLEHVHELCACERERKHALYRYELSELDALVAALEGNLDAVNGVGNLLRSFTESETSKSSCKEMHDLKCGFPDVLTGFSSSRVGSSSASFGYSTMFPATLRAPILTGTKDWQSSACISMEPIWNMGFGAMDSFFLKGLESHEKHSKSSKKAETLSFQGRPRKEGLFMPSVPGHSINSQQSSQPPFSGGHVSEEKRNVEVIVLSDDEDGLGSHSVSYSSYPTNSTQRIAELSETQKGSNSMKGLLLPLQKQGTNIARSILGSQPMDISGQSDRPTIIACEEDEKLTSTLQHTRPVRFPSNFYTSFGDYGAKDAGSNKDWLCLGHLQTSTTDRECSHFSMAGPPLSHAQYEGHRLGNLPDHIATPAAGKGLRDGLHGYPSIGQPQEVGHRVDLLNTGRLVLGMSWYNKDAIFPAGFCSRVLFPSILDPCQTCFYLSEVLDCGHAEPLFKVVMEDYPSEVFIHPSIDRCWQMVQERVNMKIQLHRGLGKMGLPSLRPLEDIRGMELFGFTCPHIIKAVESLDWRHQCLEYWTGRVTAIKLLENQNQPWTPDVNGTGYRDRINNLEEPYFMAPRHSSQTILETAAPLSFNPMKARHDVWR